MSDAVPEPSEWQLFVRALREVDRYFDRAWRRDQAGTEADLVWYLQQLPQRGKAGRCEVYRRFLALRTGDRFYLAVSDLAVIIAAKRLGFTV